MTPDGYIVPLSVRDGLAYMDMHPPTDHELEHLPHVYFTAEMPWDPRVLDNEFLPGEFAEEQLPEDDLNIFVDARVTDFGELDPTDDHEYNVDVCTLEVCHMQVTRNVFPQR